MKTRPICCELEVNTVPFEKLEYCNTSHIYLYVDDIAEQRWKLIFSGMRAIKLTSNDIGYNYNRGDFRKYYYKDDSGSLHYRNYILEVEDSVWLKSVKKKALRFGVFEDLTLSKAKHYLVTFYDYVLEIIACDLKLEKYNG